jgi:hypothetical protein
MAFIIAAIVSLTCVVYSLRALRSTIDATAISPTRVARSLKVAEATSRTHARDRVAKLHAWAKRTPSADLEADLLEAMLEHKGEAQVALVNTVLGEIDHRLHAPARIPRVCARVSSTVGLLCGAMALRHGLVEGSLDVPPLELLVSGPIADMLTAVMIGIAGAIWCGTAARALKKAADEQLAGEDALVERLEMVMANDAPPPEKGADGR